VVRRGFDKVNTSNWFMWAHFFSINLLFRSEVLQRKDFPLGDESYTSPLLKVQPSLPRLQDQPVELHV
jgi:hypothetical protein